MKRPSQIAISDRDWQRTPTAVQGLVVSSLERIGQHEQIVEHLTARVASLEQELTRRKGRSRRGAQGGSSESNVSASPRSEASGRRRSSGRSPGGQPGNEGHGRSWVSVDEVDEWIPVRPSTCHGCGQALAGDDPHPQRHQEVVIPRVRTQVIEYQLHTLRCAHCACLTAADWPKGVSRHIYGPSVQAWVGLLAGAYRMSKRNIRSLLSEAFGVEEVLGPDNPAIVGSDRYSAYAHLPPRRRKVCWAHLPRTFEEFVARGGEAACIGQQLLDASEQLFTWWHRVRDGTLKRSSFQVYVT